MAERVSRLGTRGDVHVAATRLFNLASAQRRGSDFGGGLLGSDESPLSEPRTKRHVVVLFLCSLRVVSVRLGRATSIWASALFSWSRCHGSGAACSTTSGSMILLLTAPAVVPYVWAALPAAARLLAPGQVATWTGSGSGVHPLMV